MIRQKIIIIAIMGVCLPVVAKAKCTIKYACGTGATGTAPSQETVTSGSVFTPAANTCTRDGYVFSHYLAVPSSYSYVDDGVAKPVVSYTIPFKSTSDTCSRNVTLTLTAQWVEQNPSKTTSKAYTDTQLATRQPVIPGGEEVKGKLMLFSDTTDGAFRSRDIVTTLGTPNSTTGLYTNTDADSVATHGAIVQGLNRKQNIVQGTANYVSTYTGTAGRLSPKPVYNATTRQYPNAVVEASTLNTAVIDAVNSELTQIDENGNPSSTGTLWRINDTISLMATGGIDINQLIDTNGTGYCYKWLRSDTVSAGNCTTVPVNYGDWGVMFTYKGSPLQVSGISACSTVNEGVTRGIVPTNQTGIQNDYVTSGSGTNANTNPPGEVCYCKMTVPNESAWVYNYYNSALSCATHCAEYCASYASSGVALRHGLFSSAQ